MPQTEQTHLTQEQTNQEQAMQKQPIPEASTEKKRMLGDIIKTYRKKAKLTQQELADKLHINKGTVYQYEKNKLVPRYNRLQEITTLLNIPESAFYGYSLPPMTYEPEESDLALHDHTSEIHFYNFLESMGCDLRGLFYTNRQIPHSLLQYEGAVYEMPHEKIAAIMEHIKSYSLYLINDACKDCQRNDLKRITPPEDPAQMPAHQMKHRGPASEVKITPVIPHLPKE